MARKASSPSEVGQIARVHTLLHDIGVAPSPCLEVITASGRAFEGQLMRDLVGNTQHKKGWTSHGSITLATARGKVEIDYLDVVTVEKVAEETENRASRRKSPRRKRKIKVRFRARD